MTERKRADRADQRRKHKPAVTERLDELQRQIDELQVRIVRDGRRTPVSSRVRAGEIATQILRSRREREAIFGPGIFADPAWDILLELYVAHLANRKTTLPRLCEAVPVRPTSALRWTRRLEERGWITRTPVRGRRPRVLLDLTDNGVRAINIYLARYTDLE